MSQAITKGVIMKKRRGKSNFFYFIKEGLRNIFLNGFMSFAAVSVMAACLLITGSFSLVAYNIGAIIEGMESQNEIAVYIDESFTREQALALESEIKKIDNIDTVEFISKEQAFDDYLVSMGDDAYILEDLREDNPLRDGYKITMKDISLHAETIEKIQEIAGVGDTVSRKDISDRLLQIKSVVNAISATLIALLGAVSLFIISNTVRLALFYRREEIAIMRMVGATNSFIRMPFVVEGVCLGFFGGILAYAAQFGVYKYISDGLVAQVGLLEAIPFAEFALPLFAVLAISGTCIGLVGSIFTIQRFLKV